MAKSHSTDTPARDGGAQPTGAGEAAVTGPLGRVLFEMGAELDAAARRVGKLLLSKEGQEEIRPFIGRLIEHGRVLRGLAADADDYQPVTIEEAVRRVLLVEVSDVE